MSIAPSNYVPTLGVYVATFSSDTASDEIDLSGATLLALMIDNNWDDDGGDAAITFIAKDPVENVLFSNPIKNISGIITLTGILGGDFISLSPPDFAGIQKLKIISSVSQDCTVTAILGPVLAQQNIG